MSQMAKLNELLGKSEAYAGSALKNEYVYTTLSVFFVLYGASIAPEPPAFVKSMFSNTVTKLALMTLAALTFKVDFRLALLLSLSIVLGTNVLSNRPILLSENIKSSNEGFSDFNAEYKSNTISKLLHVKTNIHPGCLDIKMADLLAAFEGDAAKMQTTLTYAFKELLKQNTSTDARERLLKTAYSAGLPYNVKFTDHNAPYIATLLIQWGYDLGGECKLITNSPLKQLV